MDFRAYGTLFDAADLGVPTEVEAYAGGTSLGVQAIDLNRVMEVQEFPNDQ